jgi:hypothetical protein
MNLSPNTIGCCDTGSSSSNDTNPISKTIVENITIGINSFTVIDLNQVTEATFFNDIQEEIEMAYKIIGNVIEVSSNLDINNITIRIEGL